MKKTMQRAALDEYAAERAEEEAEQADRYSYDDDDYDDYYYRAEYLDLVEVKKINTWERFKNV